MAYYNRVKTPKFYIDAVLLARQLVYINEENNIGKYYLNPTKTTDVVYSGAGDSYLDISFTDRKFFTIIIYKIYLIILHNVCENM